MFHIPRSDQHGNTVFSTQQTLAWRDIGGHLPGWWKCVEDARHRNYPSTLLTPGFLKKIFKVRLSILIGRTDMKFKG
jgi:hypothetical protein